MRINVGRYTLLVKWGPRYHLSWGEGSWSACDCKRTGDHYAVRELR